MSIVNSGQQTWRQRNRRALRFIRWAELAAVVVGVILAVRLRAMVPLVLFAVVCLAVLWFILGFTSIMACPHCSERLWGLSHKLSKLRFCPFCGRGLDEE